jgi:hypothetical protein
MSGYALATMEDKVRWYQYDITRIEHGAYSIIDTLDLKTVPLCHNKAYAKKVAATLGLKSWRYVKIG